MQQKSDTGLRVRPNHGDNLTFPQFERPKPVGYFSMVDGVLRNYEASAQQLRYYKPPASKNFPLDLNKNLDKAIKKPESAYDERLDNMFRFICDHRDKLFVPPATELSTQKRLCAEFVCWRGLLRLLMCTPYEHRDDWCISVARVNGVFYLHKRDTDYEKMQRAKESDHQKRMCAYGFQFEQYCLVPSPFLEPCTDSPVDECNEFSCVFVSKVGGMDIMYGAEMDGIISEQPVLLDENNGADLENLKFVELKVRQGNLNQHQQQSYNRHKTRNWWCQSFLVGIQDIYVGMRNEKGQVDRIEHTEVRSLPKKAANFWTPNVCAKFLIDFLLTLKKIMADVNCPHTVYEFYFNSNRSCITYECIEGKSEHSFLPDYYINIVQKPPTNIG